MHQVGAGVLGPVFRAYDPNGDRAVAIKAFSIDLTPEQATELSAEFERLASQGLTHPSIVAPLAGGTEGATAFLVQDYFVAESLDVAIKQYGPAPVSDALRLIGQLASALDYAAVAGVYHGSLHPRDVLVAPHDVRVTGLGVTAALERVGYRATVRRPYAGPERVDGASWGAPADVYSLASIAFELLTGRRPTIAGEAVVAETDHLAVSDRVALNEALGRALAPRPEDRFPSALAFAAALKHALTGAPLAPAIESERPRGRRSARSGASRARMPQLPLAGDETAEEDARPSTSTLNLDAPTSVPDTPRQPVRADALDLPDDSAPLGAGPVLPDDLPMAPPLGAPPDDPDAIAEALARTEQQADEDTRRGGVVEQAVPDLRVTVLDAPLTGASVTPLPSFLDAYHGADHEADHGTRAPEIQWPDALPEEDRVPEVPPRVDLPARPALRLDDLDIIPPEEEPAAQIEHGEPQPAAQHGLGEPAMLPAGPEPRSVGRWRPPVSTLAAGLVVGVLIGFPLGYLVGQNRPAAAPGAAGAGPTPTAALATLPQPPVASAQPVTPPPGQPTAPVTPPAARQDDTATSRGASTPAASRTAGGHAATGGEAERTAAGRQAPRTEATRSQPAAPARAPRQGAAPRAAATTGELQVVTRPPGARVLLDGKPVGVTPLTVPGVSVGLHQLRLEHDGYAPWTAPVRIRAGATRRVTASLERRPGG